MDDDAIYELVHEAVTQALEAQQGGQDIRLTTRMIGGRVIFEDDEGREVKAIPIASLFKKVTAVRERLRVLEQKINNHASLDQAKVAELQAYITRAYGSLTTFNFLFLHERDKFRGTGG